MSTTKSVQWTLGYTDSTQKRSYEMTLGNNATAEEVGEIVRGINESIAGGTAGDLTLYFVDDAGNTMSSITAAKYIEREDVAIF